MYNHREGFLLDHVEFVLVLYSKHRGVHYASPGKWPSPKHPRSVGGTKASPPPLYRVVSIKQRNMWDRTDEHKNLKPGDGKDDTILIFPSSAADENDPRCMTAVVDDSGTDFPVKGDSDHKWIDCKTSTQGDSKEECVPGCSTTRKLPSSILASLDRQHQLSVDSGLSGATAISREVHTSRETNDSEGGILQLDSAANRSCISDDVGVDRQQCTLMENDSSKSVMSEDHAAMSQQWHPQEHETVVEHASSKRCDCFIPLSPSTESSAVPAEKCSMCGLRLSPAMHESFSPTAALAQSPATPSQTHQSLTDGAGLQSSTPASSQSTPDPPTWISPLLTTGNSPKLLLFSDNCKQHGLVKGMMAEVHVQMCMNIYFMCTHNAWIE